jgi:hypothetical protein
MGTVFCPIHRNHIVYTFTRLNSPVINFAASARLLQYISIYWPYELPHCLCCCVCLNSHNQHTPCSASGTMVHDVSVVSIINTFKLCAVHKIYVGLTTETSCTNYRVEKTLKSLITSDWKACCVPYEMTPLFILTPCVLQTVCISSLHFVM